MDEDLILLGIKIKKDPISYKDEYLLQLRTLESLINLPTPPIKRIKPMIFFIVKHCHIDPIKSIDLLVQSLDAVSDYKVKKVILNGLVIVRQKKFIESNELLKLVITQGNDLRYFLKSVQEFLDVGCYSTLVEWFKKGTERQKCFCYFLLLVLFSKIHDVADRKRMKKAMAEVSQIRYNSKGITTSDTIDDAVENDGCSVDSTANSEYNTDAMDDEHSEDRMDEEEHDSNAIEGRNIIDESSFEDSEENEKPSQFSLVKDEVKFDNSLNLVDLDELEQVISSAFYGSSRISKICCLYFLNRTEIKFDISKLKHGQEYGRLIYKELAEEVIDRDLKLMKLKIFVIFKGYFKVKKSIIKILLSMIDLEKEDIKDLLDCLVKSVDVNEIKDVLKVISEEFVREGQQETIVVYGMNVMREIYSRFMNTVEDEIIEETKELILRYIQCFKGNRSKSILYAYRMIIKAVVKNELVDRPINHIQKKSSREEKKIMRERGREEIKRLRNETKRKEKQEKYKTKTKGRKKTAMLKFMMRPNSKKKGSR